jgi:LmbE family N-acetylglucosaminyl deacetylase
VHLRFAPQRQPLRILCLGSHADDIEIGCGGTVLRLLADHPAAVVRWVVFSASPEREREARASAEEMLAAAGERSVEVHRFRESYFPWVGAELKDAFETLKPFAPDLVLTHHRADLHQDHATVASLTWNAFRDHTILEYEIPKYEGDLGAPNVYVPLDEATARRKVEHVLRHFPSQASRAWFRAATFEAVLRLRGVECNAAHAEAFHGRKILL